MLLHGRLYLFDFRAHIVQRQERQRLPFCHRIARLDKNLFDQKTFRDGQRSSNSGGYLTGNCKALRNYTLVRGGHRDDWKRGGRGSAHQQSQQKHDARKRSMATPVCHWLGLAAAVACNRCLSLCITSKELILSQPLLSSLLPGMFARSGRPESKGATSTDWQPSRAQLFCIQIGRVGKEERQWPILWRFQKSHRLFYGVPGIQKSQRQGGYKTGNPQWNPDAPKTLPLICTIDRSGLQDFSRNRVKAALHDKYRKCRKDAR